MMRILVLILAFLFSSVAAEDDAHYTNVLRCSSFPEVNKADYYLDASDIKYPEEMRRVIPELLRLDLISKIDALSLVLPEDWRESEGLPYEVRFDQYQRSFILRQAECLIENYRDGDRLYRFEQEPNGSYDKGYALFRGEKLIAIVVTEGLRI